MALLVKICGLKTIEALDAALDAGADMVGFVFFPPSPRNLGLEAAKVLGERVKGRARKVALSVDATDAELAEAPIIYEDGRNDDWEHPPAETRYF